MILSFEFNYVSKNALLENFLDVICKDFGIVYKIGKENSIVNLQVEADEEKLKEFSDFISQRLPLSIFFKSTAVNVVDKFSVKEIEIPKCNLVLPFTPKVLNSDNPLENNEVGEKTYSDDSEIVFFENTDKIAYNSFEELYEKVAQILKNGTEVSFATASGEFTLGVLNENFKELGYEDFIIMPTDLSTIEKMAVVRENEIKSLASLEKPIIKFKVNSLFDAKDILPSKRVKVKLADEILVFKILSNLHKFGIDFVYKINKKESKYNLNIEKDYNKIPQIEICVLENGEILILEGDGYSADSLKQNLDKFDKNAYAQFASVMQEHNLFDLRVSCFYISRFHDDLIMHLSEKTGMLNLVTFPVIRDFNIILEEIEKSNTGKKLLKNYKETFPEIFEKIENIKISDELPDSINTIWGIASVILGISDDVKSGANKVVELAEEFGGLKGPRIDYKLIEEESICNQFDMLKLIRSSMSFKLAGTDDTTLSFGMMEALAYFLSDMSDFCMNNLSAQRVALCGSMFGVRRFAEVACKNIQPNIQIALNRELPIDN